MALACVRSRSRDESISGKQRGTPRSAPFARRGIAVLSVSAQNSKLCSDESYDTNSTWDAIYSEEAPSSDFGSDMRPLGFLDLGG